MQIFAKNKKAYFDYEILETWEAGLKLTGAEVKSIRGGQINLKGSFAVIEADEKGRPVAVIEKMHISRYSHANIGEYNPERKRVLLLKKKEIAKIASQLAEKGVTLLPLEVFGRGGLIKMKLGLARGKKKYDKRAAIKKRETKRITEQAIKYST